MPSARSSTVDTHTFQVYDLADGRLRMRRGDSKVVIPELEPDASKNTSPEELTGFPPEVMAIVGEYPIDNAEIPAQSGNTQVKQRRARPELRAAVSTSLTQTCVQDVLTPRAE